MKPEEFRKQREQETIDHNSLIKLLKENHMSMTDIAEHFSVPLMVVEREIKALKEKSVMFEAEGELIFIPSQPKEGGRHRLNPNMWTDGDWLRFGFVSDNHLGSHFERVDVLNLLYDVYEKEGISMVMHGGNFIEGEARFNKNEIHKHGFGRQMKYAVETYPFRAGIETWFVSGDDHEGWYNQREGINSGDYFQSEREKAGMFDLRHLGYVEADIDLNEGGEFEHRSWMRVMHPGGGSAYAYSYAPQKIVESLQPGEKPDILFLGHYHKMSYDKIRGVYVIQMGCTCDQSIYMRKKKIEAHVGGGIAEFHRSSDGIINRGRVEFIDVFDKAFYKGKDKYWKY